MGHQQRNKTPNNVIRNKMLLSITVMWCFISAAFGAYRSTSLQFAFVLATTLFLGASIISVRALMNDWRNLKLLAALPLVSCILAIPASSFASDYILETLFSHNLSSYEKVISRPEIQALPPGSKAIAIALSEEERKLAYFVLAERHTDGTLLVQIATENGFPVKHAGYLFTSSGSIESSSDMAKRCPYRYRIRQQWFRAYD